MLTAGSSLILCKKTHLGEVYLDMIKKILFLTFTAGIALSSFASESEMQFDAFVFLEVTQGAISYEAKHNWDWFEKEFGIKVPLDEPMISVTTLDKEGNQYRPTRGMLPYSLLKDKKDGDVIELNTADGTIRLLCSNPSYGFNGSFELLMQTHLTKFMKEPNFHLGAEKDLLEADIIMPHPKCSTSNGRIIIVCAFPTQHGPSSKFRKNKTIL